MGAAGPRQQRTLTRTRTSPTAARVRDFTGAPAPFSIEWDVRTVYDFLFSLSPDAGATDDLPAADRRWLHDTRASLSPAIKAEFDQLRKHELAVHLGGFLVERPALHGAREVVAAMRSEGPVPVLRWLFAELAGSDPAFAPVVDRALEGDLAARAEVRSRLHQSKHGM